MKAYYRYSLNTAVKMIVKDHLDRLGAKFEMGPQNEIELYEPLTAEQRTDLEQSLAYYDIQLLPEQQNMLVDRIKEAIRELVYSDANLESVNLSDYLSKKLNYSYGHLTSLFSEATYMSIAHFTMMQKIERIKELLLEKELTLTEISYRLNYSSVAHLSNQFKKITGLTPSRFKEIMKRKRELAQ
ncbi:MAG TPA: AraC family transcriptional regulator [Candidatus Kapabacteria bacterium]|nr:AraC family transcriptional regulator [Candidatus Kapabacteria bacterium]